MARNVVIAAKRHLSLIDKHDLQQLISDTRFHSRTLLSIAVVRGHLDTITFLVRDCQANIEQSSYERDYRLRFSGWVTPLWSAAASGKIDVVKRLVELGADVNTTDIRYRFNAIIWCL